MISQTFQISVTRKHCDSSRVVLVVIRDKDTDRVFSRRRMSKHESISFSALWNFHHIDSAYYIAVEELV